MRGETEPLARGVLLVRRLGVVDRGGLVVVARGFALSARRIEDDAVRVRLAELPDGQHGRRADSKRFALERTGDALAGGLLPLASGLSIVHHEIVVRELPGHAELERPPRVAPVVHDRASAERTPRDGDRVAAVIVAEVVVHDLVELEVLYRIRARRIGVGHGDDRVVVASVV